MILHWFRHAALVWAIALLCTATAQSQGPSPRPGASPSFTILESANPNSDNSYLKGVAALTSSDAWAVGFYNGPNSFLNLAMHWDGVSWTITPTPNPAQPQADQLKKVAAISTNDVWTVGGHGASYTLRWNGSAWNNVPLPPIMNRGFVVRNFLEDIAAVNANDIWLVGAMDARDGTTWTLTVHWDGQQWTQIPSPNVPRPPGSATPFHPQWLDAVVAISANDVWAVGYHRVGNTQYALILHWNGIEWSIVPSPNGPTGDGWLHGIAAAGPNDIWAVGEYDKPDFSVFGKALAMHWDGTSWTVANPPNPSPFGVSPLKGVVARGPNDFYAVGEWETSSQGLDTFVVHWNGSAWTQVASENPPGSGTGWNELHDITRDSSGGLWAVGKKQASFGSPNYTLVERAGDPTTPLATTSVVSRKVHGAAGPFDIDLPLTGPIGIESRLGTNGEYMLVYTFSTALSGVDNAAINAGTGVVGSRSIGPNQNQYTVQLTGVSDLQHLEVRLDGVHGQAGESIPSVVARMDVVIGDTNANRAVTGSDIGQAKANVGIPVTATNFRSDVTANGAINTSDVSAVKSKSGGGL